MELILLQNTLGIGESIKIEKIPDTLNGHTHWQCGLGKHASDPRRVMESVSLLATFDNVELCQYDF